MPVVRIAQQGAREVVFNLPEDKIASAAPGTSMQVRSWASEGQAPQIGKVRELAASADPLTRTYQAKLALDANSKLPLGATVYVFANAASTGISAIKLPTSALMQSAQGSSQVWVLDKASMTVKPVNVEVNTADGNEAVIASGVKPGDLVVSAGIQVLAPGQKVTIFQEKGSVAGINPAQSATKSVAASTKPQ
jgi:RND family efflux transporter MFP subunit